VIDPRRALEEFYSGFNAGDFDRAFSIFSPDVITVEPSLGRAASINVWREYDEAFKKACPDAKLTVRSVVREGDRLAVQGSLRGTFKAPYRTPLRELQPTGSSFDVEFAQFLLFRDGKVVEHQIYYDQVDFGRQLGVIP
jgi:predicted ester cyclase